jgi:hypothetical protein
MKTKSAKTKKRTPRPRSEMPISFTVDVYDSSEGWCVIVKRYHAVGIFPAQKIYGPHLMQRFKYATDAALAGAKVVANYERLTQ